MDKNLNEAGAVAYFSFKRTDGFEVCLTLRDSTGKEVLERINGAISEVVAKGGTPLPLRNTSFSKPQVPTKPCPVHKVPMKERIDKRDGVTKYFSHSQGQYPNFGEWCTGKGYPSESQESYPDTY